MSISNEKEDILRQLVATDQVIPLAEIPNIDLYADQVTTFMEDRLSGTKRGDKDKIITKTMINNYTKDKILPPPVKKKYSKRHLIALIILYCMKPILNITDIGRLLNNRKQEISLEALYEKFTLLQQEAADLTSWLDDIVAKIEGMEKEEEDRLLLLVLYLVVEANTRKQMAEKIIDRYFAEKKG